MTGRFQPRPTRPTGVQRIGGWRLKTYEITLDDKTIAQEIAAAALEAVERAIPPVRPGQLAIGFLIVHHGAESVWVLADRWTDDILCQHTFSAPLQQPTAFSAVPAGGPTACVWELEVHAHERSSYVTHILDPEDGPHVDAYLTDTRPIAVFNHRELIHEFNRAWIAGDLDGLMVTMTDDPVYRASTGLGPGTEYRGRTQVRAGFAAVIASEASTRQAIPPPGDIVVCGDRGLSFWSYPVLDAAGESHLVEGVDVWTFRDGRIAIKDAYRKAFPESKA